MALPSGWIDIERRAIVRSGVRPEEPPDRDPQQEQRQRQPATPPGIDTDPRTSERLGEILYRADPAHRAAYQRGARCRDEDQGDPEDTANDEPEHPGNMRLNQGQVDEDEDDLENAPPPTGGEPGRADVHRHRSIAPSVAWHRDASHGHTLQGTRTGAGKRLSDGVWTEIDSARSAPANVMLVLRRAVLATVGSAEFAVGYLFYFRPHLALTVLGRPVLDTVISRQYGLFLASVALMYGIVALNPVDYRRFIWIAVAQRAAELSVAVIDWRAGALPASSFAYLAIVEAGLAGILVLCASGNESPRTQRCRHTPSDVWLARTLNAFGGLQLFWAVLSTIFVQLGARLLGWKLQDAYMTQQQGVALFVIGLTSLVAGSAVRRYRRFIWVPVSSQVLGYRKRHQ